LVPPPGALHRYRIGEDRGLDGLAIMETFCRNQDTTSMSMEGKIAKAGEQLAHGLPETRRLEDFSDA
jgi:hypothetical protein